MKVIYRDSAASLLAIFGAVVMFAKLNSYKWWLLGSWKGALGVLAVIGVLILLTNAVALLKLPDGATIAELLAWLTAATVVIASLFAKTTKAEFIWAGALIGLAWLAQTGRDTWLSTTSPDKQLRHA